MDIISFIKEYGAYILTGLSIIIEVIILFCKKRPKTLDDFLDCLHQCETIVPSLISKVEVPGDGASKRLKVLDGCIEKMSSLLGREMSMSEKAIFEKSISDQIEEVLSTPTKKGVN